MTTSIVRKDPLEQIEVDFDFTAYLALRGEVVVLYNSYADTGIEIISVTAVGGIYTALIGGGVSGTQYNVGLSIFTNTDAIKLIKKRIRVVGETLVLAAATNSSVIIQDGSSAVDIYIDSGTVSITDMYLDDPIAVDIYIDDSTAVDVHQD